jgi:hypothetical protein
MSRISRRVWAQGVATSAVAITGIVLAATSGAAASVAAAASSPAVSHLSPAAPTSHVGSSTPTRHVRPHHAKPVVHLRHPKHESWTKLLGSTHGWSVTHPASSVSAGSLSKDFRKPSAVRHDLHFNGYRRGVLRATRGSSIGVIEEIWNFRRPTGASAWFATYVASNDPGPKSDITHAVVAGRRMMVLTAKKTDGTGYHFGEGLALEGDMIVAVRVFSTHGVNRKVITHQLRQAARPVARGIKGTNLTTALGQATHHHKAPAINT